MLVKQWLKGSGPAPGAPLDLAARLDDYNDDNILFLQATAKPADPPSYTLLTVGDIGGDFPIRHGAIGYSSISGYEGWPLARFAAEVQAVLTASSPP